MTRRSTIAVLLLLAGAAFAAAWLWYPWVLSPNYTIRIATGPIGSDGQKFIAAFKREVADQRPRVRLALEETASLREGAEALASGRVDLAVVRSDDPVAAGGGTIVIVRRIPLVFMVPARSSVESVRGLVRKKVALLEGTAADDPLLAMVMESCGLKAENLVKTSLADVGAALRDKRVAAVVAMGPAGPGVIGDAVRAIVKATGKAPKFLDVDAAKSISEKDPVYEEATIAQGTFLAAPATPDDDVSTVAVTVRLVASHSVLNYVAGELTRLLLVTRAKLAATVPGAGKIEAPDTDNSGFLPAHPGAAAYLDGSQESIYDQAMNQLFNFSIIGGILGSLAVWVAGVWRRNRPDETQRNLARLPAILREVNSAPLAQLGPIEEELDTLSGWLLDRFVREQIPADRIAGVSAIVAHIRHAIERRRKLG